MSSLARPSARPFLVAAVSCVALVLLAIGLADRPFSTWSHAEFHGDQGFIWLTWIVDPIPPLAVAGLIGAGIAAAAGWRPGAKGRVLLAVCLETVAALVVKDQLKILFGRTWPETWTNNNPSWIGNGTFGFEPLHGGAGWFSFPSGHTTLITAPMMVLWLCVPRLRAILGRLDRAGRDRTSWRRLSLAERHDRRLLPGFGHGGRHRGAAEGEAMSTFEIRTMTKADVAAYRAFVSLRLAAEAFSAAYEDEAARSDIDGSAARSRHPAREAEHQWRCLCARTSGRRTSQGDPIDECFAVKWQTS